MAIVTLDDWFSSQRQHTNWNKTVARTSVATGFFSMFELAGSPGAGTLAIGNTANGVVPTDATAGYPAIKDFAGGAIGYVSGAWIENSVVSMVAFYDRLWAGGAYAFNANTAVTSSALPTTRLPSGPDYNNLELWVEQVTTATLNQAVNVTYTDQSGNTGATTGAVGIGAAPTVGRCWNLPLASGDSGLQAVTNVAGTVASAGTFNVMVLRPLFCAWVASAGEGRNYGPTDTGMTQVFQDSAIYAMIMAPVGTSSGTPYCDLTMASK